MLYTLLNGETVRVRTSNDHALVTVASKPTENAHLNIEGTDWLLIVMPKIERTTGKVIGYLVPTKEAVKEVRKSHKDWLSSEPNTKGENTTWILRLGQDGSESNGCAIKWKKYRLEGSVTSTEIEDAKGTHVNEVGNIKTEVEAAQQRIARMAGVSPQAVKISIDFGD